MAYSKEFTKITAEDVADKGVVGLADTPNLSTQDMQKKFDELATDVIIPKFNNLVDELDAEDMDKLPHSDDITNFKLDSDGKLQVSTDNGSTYKAAGSSGHLLVDGSGTEYPARSRMQFSDNVTMYDYDTDNGNKTFISIPSGEKGDKGESATIKVGTVTSGSEPAIENVGSDTDAIFNFTLAKGDNGSAATIQVGTVQSGTTASVSNRGTTSNAIFDFTLPKGEKGDAGTSFQILGMYATYEDLIAEHPTGSRGDAYAVGDESSNVVYNWNNDTKTWDNLGAIRGAKGDTGDAATITVGTVTESETMSVENVGTTTNAILNFGLKKGEKGDTGSSATIAIGTVTSGDTPSVVNSGTSTNAILDFVLEKGEKGDRGNPTVVNGKSGVNITLGATDLLMTDYVKPSSYSDIEVTDSISEAIGKLEMKQSDGASSIIHVDTTESTWMDNEDVTVTIADSEETFSGHFDSTGDYYHKVKYADTYTITVTDGEDTYTATVEVTTIGSVYYVNIEKEITQTVTFYAGASETITYERNGTTYTLGTTDTSGTGTGTITFQDGEEITFTGNVAKDTDAGTTNYSKKITLTKSTTTLSIMPNGALYWYGYENTSAIGSITLKQVDSGASVSKKTNSLYMYGLNGTYFGTSDMISSKAPSVTGYSTFNIFGDFYLKSTSGANTTCSSGLCGVLLQAKSGNIVNYTNKKVSSAITGSSTTLIENTTAGSTCTYTNTFMAIWLE